MGHPFMTSTRREEGVRLRWTPAGGGRSAMWSPLRNLEPTDVILSSSCANKLAFLGPEFYLWTE